MTWKGEKQRHQMSAKGIKTTQDGMYYDAEGVRLKWVKYDRAAVEKAINHFKNEGARKKAQQFLNDHRKRPLVVEKDQIIWGLGGDVEDGYGNDWRQIAIIDKRVNFLEGTMSLSVSPHRRTKDFAYLDKIVGVGKWKLMRNPLTTETSALAPIISTLGIKIKGETFGDLDSTRKEVNKRINKKL